MLILTLLAALALQAPAPDEAAAGALFKEGFDKLRKSQQEEDKAAARALAKEALIPLRKIVKEHPGSKVYGMSHFNVAVALSDFLDRPEEAIKEFEALIA